VYQKRSQFKYHVNQLLVREALAGPGGDNLVLQEYFLFRCKFQYQLMSDQISTYTEVSFLTHVRSKPVDALKTALEGSALKTRDERCKVPF
jgi:hypothetical protein